MSRIGKKPITIPQQVKANISDNKITVEGKNGKLEHTLPNRISAELKDNILSFKSISDSKLDKSLLGTTRAVLTNMIKGVSEGYVKQLDIIGVDNISNFIVKDFKKPKISILKKGRIREGTLISKLSEKLMKISIKINRKRCILCEECVRHCPAEALVNKNDRIYVDHDKCIECFCCGESCPNNAISAKFYFFRVIPLAMLLVSIAAIIILWFITSLF